MKTIEYRFLENKADWGDGPWIAEPDKVQFPDPATGLPCLAVRHPDSGHWCGYVGVGPDHPDYGKHYDDVGAYAHGGLTFSEFCVEDDKEQGVCHVAEAGDFEPAWWLGFDCIHSGDLGPAIEARMRGYLNWPTTGTYKDLTFVKGQCADLASQLKARQ